MHYAENHEQNLICKVHIYFQYFDYHFYTHISTIGAQYNSGPFTPSQMVHYLPQQVHNISRTNNPSTSPYMYGTHYCFSTHRVVSGLC